MYKSIVKVTPQEDYKLLIEFEDNTKKLLDMKPYLNFGLFRHLQDRNNFNSVRVAFDTIEWAIGVDLDPEFVYDKSESIG